MRALTKFSLLVSTTLVAAPLSTLAADPEVATSGYVEMYYQWNLGNPSNGLTNWRGFDNRHNSFTLDAVALTTTWQDDGFTGTLGLQYGATPRTYYATEPALAGAGGASATGADVWQYVQQANVAYRLPQQPKLELAAGLFLSPIGPEGIAVRDNWNFSRSNLFFGLPFYHTGARAKLAVSDRLSITAAGYNGYNSVVDNNDAKSVSLQFSYAVPEQLTASVLYFGGVERSEGAPEGSPWRHLIDAHATWHVTPALSLLAHVDVGVEQTKFGRSHWEAAALYARYKLSSELMVAARGDIFRETAAKNDDGQAGAIFFPTTQIASATGSLSYQPTTHALVQLEIRHDRADDDLFFSGDVALTPEGNAIANASDQSTISVGVTAWF